MNKKIKRHYRKGWKKESDYGSIATTRILTRILIILGEVKYGNKSELIEKIGIKNGYIIQDGLLFLTNHNLISEINGVYCLKEFEKQVSEIIKIKKSIEVKKWKNKQIK